MHCTMIDFTNVPEKVTDMTAVRVLLPPNMHNINSHMDPGNNHFLPE